MWMYNTRVVCQHCAKDSRPTGIIALWCNNPLLRSISTDSCQVVGKWTYFNATVIYLVWNNSVEQHFYMDKTTQCTTSHNWTEMCLYHLKSIDSERSYLWKVLVWLPMKWSAWFYCLSDLSLVVMSRASFSTFFTASNNSWNIQNLCSAMSWLQEFYIATFSFFTCNFHQVGLIA